MITDHIGDITFIPKRIVSVVPSQTELLFDLGLEHEVLGITKFCIHPKEICQTKTIVGGTKNLNIEKNLNMYNSTLKKRVPQRYKNGSILKSGKIMYIHL